MLLDFGPIYTETGNLLQLEYSMKAVNQGSTCIGFRYNDGIIMAVENPIDTHLYKVTDRAQELAPNIFCASTGIQSDSVFITESLKKDIHSESLRIDTLVNASLYKRTLSGLVSIFTTLFSTRPVGCSFLSAIYDGTFHLLLTDPSSLTQECFGCAIGKGTQRAKTEMEKLDTENLDLKEAIEQSVRILYKCFDPLKDKPFMIEIFYMNRKSNGGMNKVDRDLIEDVVDMYKDLSIDE